MKFCHVTTFFPPYHFGGDAVFVANLANLLVANGHDVTVVHCLDSFNLLRGSVAPSNYPVDPRVRVKQIHINAFSPLLTHISGRPVLKQRALSEALDGHDVVHWHNLSLVAGPGGLSIPRSRQVATLHDYWLICPMSVLFDRHGRECESRECIRCAIAHGRPPQLWRFGSWTADQAARLDTIFAPSRDVQRRVLRSHLKLDTRVLPHFVPPFPRPTAPPARDYYFYSGRLERVKGLHTVLPFFSDRRPLIVAGDGSQMDALRRDALPGVTFLGRVSRDRLAELYAGARATIVPSICPETFGLTALESMQCGTPVIVSDFGALPEIVEATGGGLIYRDLQELTALLDQAGREPPVVDPAALAAYSPEAHLRTYLSILSA